MTGAEHLRRQAAPVVAASALLAHDVDDEKIRDYLKTTWGLADDEARAAISAARALGGDPSAMTVLPPDGAYESS